MRLIALALLVGGCAQAGVCDGKMGTCIAVEVRGALLIDQLRISSTGAFLLNDAATPPQPRTEPTALPVRFALLPGEVAGPATLTLRAFFMRELIGTAMQTVIVERGTHQDLVLQLTDPVDLAARPDLLPPRDLARADLTQVIVVCDPVSQSPCGASEKCLLGTGATGVCVPAGSIPPGGHCNAQPDPCVRGSNCLLLDGNLDGQCTQFCGNDSDCDQAPVAVGGTPLPSNGPHCAFTAGAGGPQICSVPCNPVAKVGSSGCPVGRTCSYSSVGAPEMTFCNGAGDGGLGNPCDSNLGCAVGLNCKNGDGGALVCRNVCRAGNSGDCEPGFVCTTGLNGGSSMFGYCCPPAGC